MLPKVTLNEMAKGKSGREKERRSSREKCVWEDVSAEMGAVQIHFHTLALSMET